MANLLDTIRANNPALQQQGQTDQTQSLQTLMRAKSGKAVSGPEVASSNLQEQQAVQQTNNQMQNQIAPAAQIQNEGQREQQTAQTQQTQQKQSEIAQGRRFDDLQTKIKTDQILADLERGKGKIATDQSNAQLEQVGQNLRLQNAQYIDNLQREGNMSRLGDDASFKQELARSVLGNNQALLEKQLGNKSILDTNSREFKEAMAKMDVNTAWDMFGNSLAAEKQRAAYSGAGSLATAGIGAYGAYQKDADAKKDTK